MGKLDCRWKYKTTFWTTFTTKSRWRPEM